MDEGREDRRNGGRQSRVPETDCQKEYLVHDLDNVKIEMHGDIAITYGRYVSLFMPKNRNPNAPANLSTIWFERVYAKRGGRWQFVSHRTVHGPTVSPAGVDPTQILPSQAAAYVTGLPRLQVKAETFRSEYLCCQTERSLAEA